MTAEAPPPENPTDPAELDDPSADTLDALDSALDAMRERHPDTTPQWEYAEGVLTALLCTRRAVRSMIASRESGSLAQGISSTTCPSCASALPMRFISAFST